MPKTNKGTFMTKWQNLITGIIIALQQYEIVGNGPSLQMDQVMLQNQSRS